MFEKEIQIAPQADKRRPQYVGPVGPLADMLSESQRRDLTKELRRIIRESGMSQDASDAAWRRFGMFMYGAE